MKKIFLIASLVIFSASLVSLQAAPKAEVKKEKPKDGKYGAPTEGPLVQLNGGEAPEQIKKAYADAISTVLPKIGTDDQPSFQSLEATIHYAARPGAEAERTGCCLAVADAINAATQTEVRVILLQHLINTGGKESVALETKLLADSEQWIRETARRALQNNPAAEATAALRDALAKAAEPSAKSAMALALAARKDTASVPAIAKLLSEKDDGVAAVALDTLADIGGPDAAKTLMAALKNTPEKNRLVAATACLKCARQFIRSGQTAEAVAILHELNQPTMPLSIRHAALNTMLAADGDKAAPKILELLAGSDADGRSVALGRIPEMGAERKALIDGLEKLPAEMQATVLGSLAGVGEKAAMPLAMKFARGQDAALRTAGLKALAQLGDASNAGMVCDALVTTQDKAERTQLEQLLVNFPGGAATDEAIISAMQKAAGDARLSLMSVLGKRGSHAAVPVLLTETASQDVNAAKCAFQTLGTLAAADDVPALLEKIATLKSNTLRNDADSAASRAIARVEPAAKRSEIVLKTLGSAADSDSRKSMLKLLAACGDAKALETATAALKDNDAGIREAAVRSLASWQESNAWDVLTRIYSQPEKESFGAIALRGLVRMTQNDKSLSGAKQVARYRELLSGAKNDGDRKTILSGLNNVTDPAALDLILPLLSNPSIRAETELAVKTIAEAIKKNHPDAARAALEKLK